jgi:hypothetical protein
MALLCSNTCTLAMHYMSVTVRGAVDHKWKRGIIRGQSKERENIEEAEERELV